MSTVPDCLSPDVLVPCWLCGDLLHQVANERTDEFTWAGEDGSTAGTDSDLRPLEQFGGAYAYLAWLDAEMGGCTRCPASARTATGGLMSRRGSPTMRAAGSTPR